MGHEMKKRGNSVVLLYVFRSFFQSFLKLLLFSCLVKMIQMKQSIWIIWRMKLLHFKEAGKGSTGSQCVGEENAAKTCL